MSLLHEYPGLRFADPAELERMFLNPHCQKVKNIPADEPIWVLRGKDLLTPRTIRYWITELVRVVSKTTTRTFLDGVSDLPTIYRLKLEQADRDNKAVIEWQQKNKEQVKIPD